MKIILFDASIHLGQFCISDDKIRIACKNSQASIPPSADTDVKAYYTFFENGWMDDVIWSLDRVVQDTFYPFMDVFYSNKNITGLADNIEEMSFATMLASKFPSITSSSAITCALAVTRRVDEVHTLYHSMLDPKLIAYLKDQYGVLVQHPTSDSEMHFAEDDHDLEKLYQAAYKACKDHKVNLIAKLPDTTE